MAEDLKNSFFSEGAEIAYPCWGYEGGRVIAKWDGAHECWLSRHETTEAFGREHMSEARARHIFPTDAVLVEA